MPNLDIVIPSFNSGAVLRQTLESVIRQEFCDGWIVNVVIVDDASTDDSISSLPASIKDKVQISRLHINQGRAAARNHGANIGNSEYILFMDSDCTVASHNSFQLLANLLGSDCDLAYGRVMSRGTGFWVRYFNAVSNKRDQLGRNQDLSGFSSPYFGVSRQMFNRSGGFNKDYLKYGFEDRDLILRINSAGGIIRYVSDSVVYHDEIDSFNTIALKFEEAGQYSSVVFEQSHPDVYRKMLYGRIDSRLHPYLLKPIAAVSYPAKNYIYQFCDAMINANHVPFSAKSYLVKAASALAYCIGTSRMDE
ncbi:MAG: glycosyltransferase involved in cell wall biosynthesis [Gammaproteobacteria bacterium]|jgi:glycosyltransferase involved in cell wall biosynthesis